MTHVSPQESLLNIKQRFLTSFFLAWKCKGEHPWGLRLRRHQFLGILLFVFLCVYCESAYIPLKCHSVLGWSHRKWWDTTSFLSDSALQLCTQHGEQGLTCIECSCFILLKINIIGGLDSTTTTTWDVMCVVFYRNVSRSAHTEGHLMTQTWLCRP